MQRLVEIGQELGKRLLIFVEQALAGHIEAVGSVGLVHEFVMEDVQNHGSLVFVIVSVNGKLLAANVLLNQETASSHHKFRKIGLCMGKIAQKRLRSLAIIFRIVDYKDPLAQKAYRGLNDARIDNAVRIKRFQFVDTHLLEEKVGINVATDTSERRFIFHKGNAVQEALVFNMLINPSERVLGNGINLARRFVGFSKFTVIQNFTILDTHFRHLVAQHRDVIFLQCFHHHVRRKRSL